MRKLGVVIAMMLALLAFTSESTAKAAPIVEDVIGPRLTLVELVQ
jgi:hypothetical protein